MPKSSFDDILDNAKCLLEILGNRPKRRTEWSIAAREKKISFNQFDCLLLFLLKREYVERLRRGVYRRTEKGTAFIKIV